MIERETRELHLPKILTRNNTIDTIDLKRGKHTERGSLVDYLQEVRLQQMSVKRWQEEKKEQRYKRLEKTNQIYEQITRLQVKKFEARENTYRPEQQDAYEDNSLTASVYRYDTAWKPPHRYKTAIAFSEDQILVFGGFGSEQYMGLAKFSLKEQEWQIPKLEQKKQLALYSHSMIAYRGSLFVFGGIKMDSPSNQLIQINLKAEKTSQLTLSPYRRRDHAMGQVNRFLIVQGGIEGENEVRNTLFYFDTDSGRWNVPSQYQMPYLSHHSLIVVPMKTRKKHCTFQEAVMDAIYIFGGKDDKEKSTNRLCRIRVRESGDIVSEDIFVKGAPLPRHSACVQFIEPSYICVYGGRSDEESSGRHMSNGIFNDLSLFHIDKRQWIVPLVNIELPYRFGACSCSSRNRLYFFGGNEANGYSDGNIVEVVFGKDEEEKTQEQPKRGKLRC